MIHRLVVMFFVLISYYHISYKQALHSANAARSLAAKHNFPFTRPSDYFAEMVKSDSHMERIRQRLLDESATIKKGEEKRREREGKKFGKQVQIEKLKEREKSKKEMEERLKSLKRSTLLIYLPLSFRTPRLTAVDHQNVRVRSTMHKPMMMGSMSQSKMQSQTAQQNGAKVQEAAKLAGRPGIRNLDLAELEDGQNRILELQRTILIPVLVRGVGMVFGADAEVDEEVEEVEVEEVGVGVANGLVRINGWLLAVGHNSCTCAWLLNMIWL